jgi:D-sedoheptulose 7-phosphate isomerase
MSLDVAGTVAESELRALARARFRASADVPEAFFQEHADAISLACRDLARAFHGGHRLLVWGEGGRWSDAVHVSVEFVHPVIVGKRALPAVALAGDPLAQLRALCEPGDAALVFVGDPPDRAREALAVARGIGALTIALTSDGGECVEADHVFGVACTDPALVQETHETLYHVLWELVHVFLEHPEVLR